MSGNIRKRGPAWYWWPCVGVWRFASLYERRLGIFAALLTGIVLVIVGAIMCLTIAGALLGIPAFLLGATLIARSLY